MKTLILVEWAGKQLSTFTPKTPQDLSDHARQVRAALRQKGMNGQKGSPIMPRVFDIILTNMEKQGEAACHGAQ
eukprot:2115501-Karenia_brevis.AAC.1